MDRHLLYLLGVALRRSQKNIAIVTALADCPIRYRTFGAFRRTHVNFTTLIRVAKCSVYFHLTSKSYVTPLQIPCKSHFSPILWNGLAPTLERTYSGGEAKDKRT